MVAIIKRGSIRPPLKKGTSLFIREEKGDDDRGGWRLDESAAGVMNHDRRCSARAFDEDVAPIVDIVGSVLIGKTR